MKNLFLAVLIFCGSLAIPSQPVKASGATVVFLQVSLDDYVLNAAIRDKHFSGSKLINFFETTLNSVYVARINPFIYSSVYYYSALGYSVSVDFDEYKKVTFSYIPALRLMVGKTDDEEDIIVLQPIVGDESRFSYGYGEHGYKTTEE